MMLYWQYQLGDTMARISDHPVRLARLRASMTQADLAKRAGVQRSAITAIEDGRTKKPSEAVLTVLANASGTSIEELQNVIRTWLDQAETPDVKPAVKNLMAIPPYVLNQYYRSFQQWRKEIAPTPTALASLLRLNAAVVSRYEAGDYKRGMPEVLSSKLLKAFGPYGLTTDYILELEKLPAHE
jgi:transcriptional regulator with XRE-family HTH domain